MVKILANGEIVPDSDPRAKAASAPVQRKTQNEPARVHGSTGSSSSSSASSSSAPQGGIPNNEENVIIGDLARAVGVYGKTQNIMGHDIPLIYLIVGGILAFLYASGNMDAIRMLVLGFVLYIMFSQYQKAQAAGATGGLGGFFGGMGGGPGGGAGQNPHDNSSGGHVINRGNRPQ
eukprot:TRINITY_DN4046_c0_g1_i2.p1 TRINITY_DN4046_c0_g1~~TRINITY_DN4046_c0_g1_i2.p1  ORF type:complete len:176 (-),score=18.08 TRINITY_DN4046_c0_g1_i2:359-886(-)